MGKYTSDYDDLLKSASETYGVDYILLKGVMLTESSGNPQAESSAGAKGLMQLMPSTFESVAGSGANILDPVTNINAGAKYLKQLLDDNNGNTTLALASYNAGGNNVKKYGAEKYSNYYNTVYDYMSELEGMGEGTSTLDKTVVSTEADIEVKWYGQLLVVIGCVVLAVMGVALFSGAILNGDEISKTTDLVKKVTKKIKKGGAKNA